MEIGDALLVIFDAGPVLIALGDRSSSHPPLPQPTRLIAREAEVRRPSALLAADSNVRMGHSLPSIVPTLTWRSPAFTATSTRVAYSEWQQQRTP